GVDAADGRWTNGRSRAHHHDLGGLGELHPQPLARDLVDSIALGPGGLLQLQPAEVDVELVALVLEPGQLHEQLPVLVARVHHADGADHVGRQQHGDEDAQGHGRASAGSFSATRSTALRARGLAEVSSASALIAPPMARRLGTKVVVWGRRRSAGGGLARPAMNRLTMRSSSEWKLITASRPPGRSASCAAASPSSRSDSSRLTWMRMAWNERVAGWMSGLPGARRCRGTTEAISPASSPVRSSGASARRATMARAMRRLIRSSPYVHSTSAISASSARASHPAALSPDSGSMRMSSGPSLPKLKPRSAWSS